MYSVRILRRAIKDIANLPSGYAHLVGERIDHLRENPRPAGAKKLQGMTGYRISSKAPERSLPLIVYVVPDSLPTFLCI